ncbi:hypothetical protein, partial [Pseudomonas ogarae]|uniref:hypothetical protein n=1 Tax=Pseudomonas ogarae (strain DSM 112162 / CECT 30235 / F113) TaxID=1114970 RepID=UPI00194DAF5C
VRIEGVGKNGRPSAKNIPREVIQVWSSHAFNRLETAGQLAAVWMPVNADGAVPIGELLRYYGILANDTDWGNLSKANLTRAIATL